MIALCYQVKSFTINIKEMKKFIAGVILFAGSSLFTFNSCKRKQTTTANTAHTTLSEINEDPSLSIFSTIASFSGDENSVNNSTAIIIPVDSAFIKAGITAKVAARLSPPECDSIVMYYIMSDKINFNASAGKKIEIASRLGPALFADSTNSALYFNGVSVVSKKPARVGKSSIYKLTQFINMPEETVSEIAASDTSLSLFNEALKRTGFEGTLSNGSFTLFMPINNAFRSAGYTDISRIDHENIQKLTQILLCQAIPNNYYFENELKKQITLTTLQGKTVHVSGRKNLKLAAGSNPSSVAYVMNNGMLAENVLTYKISNVLLP
jgi:uncharacterized surface protein with fasciclin (FAS1) repeats